MSRIRRFTLAVIAGAVVSVLSAGPALANCVEHAVCYGSLDTVECHALLGR